MKSKIFNMKNKTSIWKKLTKMNKMKYLKVKMIIKVLKKVQWINSYIKNPQLNIRKL